MLTKGFGFHLKDLCNVTPLEEFVHIADRNVSRLTQEIICKSSIDWLNKAQNHFLSNLDFLKPIQVSLISFSFTICLNFDFLSYDFFLIILSKLLLIITDDVINIWWKTLKYILTYLLSAHCLLLLLVFFECVLIHFSCYYN